MLPILISISALGTANVSLFGAARYCMVGAQYGYLPEVFACIHRQRLTPLPGVFLEVLSFSSYLTSSNNSITILVEGLHCNYFLCSKSYR